MILGLIPISHGLQPREEKRIMHLGRQGNVPAKSLTCVLHEGLRNQAVRGTKQVKVVRTPPAEDCRRRRRYGVSANRHRAGRRKDPAPPVP